MTLQGINLGLFFVLALTVLPITRAAEIDVAEARAAINAVLKDPYLKRVDVGIQIVRIADPAAAKPSPVSGDAAATGAPTAEPTEKVSPAGPAGEIVFELNAAIPRTPASNLKLITTAAAVEGLGGDFKFQTLLVSKDNKLAIVGDGDPTLGDAEMLKKFDWKSTTIFEKWAEVVKEQKSQVAWEIVYDDSIFDETFIHPNWPMDQIHKRYVAPVGGINFNANCLDFYIKPAAEGERVDYVTDPPASFVNIINTAVRGRKNALWLSRNADGDDIELRGQTPAANGEPFSVTIKNPAIFASNVLRATVSSAGVAVGPGVSRDATLRPNGKEWKVLAVYESPIVDVIPRANKDSMNLYAEALCKRLGAAKSKEPGSWKNGTAAVGDYLKSVGIDAAEFTLDDGCGLSQGNKVSPHAIVTVLRAELAGDNAKAYLASLAVGGVDGTLEDRFKDASIRGRVHGKSGFIAGVSTLGGVFENKNGEWFAFSIMFNKIPPGTNSTAKKLQERIVTALDN